MDGLRRLLQRFLEHLGDDGEVELDLRAGLDHRQRRVGVGDAGGQVLGASSAGRRRWCAGCTRSGRARRRCSTKSNESWPRVLHGLGEPADDVERGVAVDAEERDAGAVLPLVGRPVGAVGGDLARRAACCSCTPSGPSTNSCTSHGWSVLGWQSSTATCPASGPVFVSSATPPRENAARAKNCGNWAMASRSEASSWATSVRGMRTPTCSAMLLEADLVVQPGELGELAGVERRHAPRARRGGWRGRTPPRSRARPCRSGGVRRCRSTSATNCGVSWRGDAVTSWPAR